MSQREVEGGWELGMAGKGFTEQQRRAVICHSLHEAPEA